eukprot:Protomagalhaensia_wolfi_Nauph_80__4640@NODE_47_length_4232_cov_143_859289_g38_i0_p2_GENE_NODE_47_length_4232_cov_143_859289_g38_i0NODE_47_length_4232_cov_143_859289_g38_i0_p2_ORF_typecomplete_len492_score113_60Sec62/PF03839_16/3_4e37SURF4/PF02077_15/0_096DUF2254/PF10011_9/43DUF2254/PF10011_9/1_1e02_NODE_47_length_4232_cov_143_859289_g38_i08612336
MAAAYLTRRVSLCLATHLGKSTPLKYSTGLVPTSMAPFFLIPPLLDNNNFTSPSNTGSHSVCCGGRGPPLQQLILEAFRGPLPPQQTEWDPVLEGLVKLLLSSNGGIKKKGAIEVGTRPVEYFRGVDFPKWVAKHRETLLVKYAAAMDIVAKEAQSDSADKMIGAKLSMEIGQTLIRHGFIARAEHRPIAPVDSSAADTTATSAEDAAVQAQLRDNAKWPHRLGLTKDNQKFDTPGFYIILYEESSSLNHIVLGLIVVGVMLACLFPIWPVKLKIAAYNIGVVLATLLLILSIIRLVLFGLCWFGGCDFWFLPNLFNEDVGVIDSFIPAYTFEKRKDDWLMVAARIFLAVLCVGCFYKLSETHTLTDVGNVASKSFLDILDWGHQKLGDAPANPESDDTEEAVKLTAEQIKARDWDKCVKHCEFADYEEFNDFCYTDCACFEELWASNCWKKCSDEVRAELTARNEQCALHEPEEEIDIDDGEGDEAKDEL